MKRDRYQFDAVEGSLLKGIAIALLCQIAYVLAVFELPWAEARTLGLMLFALVQFGYLFPLALFYERRGEAATSHGVISAGAISLCAAAGWFGYAALHGTLPSLN